MIFPNPYAKEPESYHSKSGLILHVTKASKLILILFLINLTIISNTEPTEKNESNANEKFDNYENKPNLNNNQNSNNSNTNNIYNNNDNNHQQRQEKQEKNILVLVFPGGKSHNFVMKELFDFSMKNSKNFKYNYHILVHNWDKDFWTNYQQVYKILGFGDIPQFDLIFKSALDLVRKDPIFGYTKFNRAMIHILDQFMQSGLLEGALRQTNFDMIMTDIPNFLFKFLRSELKIKLALHLSPPALPNLFYNLFEINAATLPALGTPFTDDLGFFQRLQNNVFILGMKIMFKVFMGEQSQVFKNYGYSYSDSDVFVYDAMILIQYPLGFCFSISKPSNMVFLNYITPKNAKELEDKEISAFLDKHEKNIYLSQGTIIKNINFAKILGIFGHFAKQKIGFVLSIKKEVSDKHIFPENVFLTDWVNQNDLLGDNRIHLFITHSGINSVLEAIYHEKPVIALGVSMDQVNTAGVVKARETGIVFTSAAQITPQNLIPAIEKTLEENNVYLSNTKKYAKILKANEQATDVYNYWLEYGFQVGYEHLIVKAYSRYSFMEINNFDVGLFVLLLTLFVLYLIKRIFACIFCYGINNNKVKLD